MNSKGQLYIIAAASGSGKTSLIKKLLDDSSFAHNKIILSISHTTRLPRGNEEHGKEYFFVTEDEFIKKIESDDFLEYAKVFGNNYYGTSKQQITDWLENGVDVILDIDWQGARLIKKNWSNVITIFILPPSLKELRSRLVLRGTDSKEVIDDRMSKSINEIIHYNEFDYVLINEVFDDCYNELKSIILSNRLKYDRTKKYIDKFVKNNIL